MFGDTVYYPHALEIQLLFMRALFENLIRDLCTRKPSKRGKINENINSNNELQKENTHMEKRKKEKEKQPTKSNRILHMCTMSFFQNKKRKDKAATISAPDETHRLERTKDAIIIIKPYHISSLCIQSLPFHHEYDVGEWESAIFVSFRKMIPFSVTLMHALARAHMHTK